MTPEDRVRAMDFWSGPVTIEPLYLRRSAAEEKRDSLQPGG